jgi:hypothetical protein
MTKNRLLMMTDAGHVRMQISVDVLILVQTIQLQYLLYYRYFQQMLVIEHDDELKKISYQTNNDLLYN